MTEPFNMMPRGFLKQGSCIVKVVDLAVLYLLMDVVQWKDQGYVTYKKQAILLKKGQACVSQNDLAEHTGTSRKAIRYSLQRLTKHGFLVQAKGQGGAKEISIYNINLAVFENDEGPSKGPSRGQAGAKQGPTDLYPVYPYTLQTDSESVMEIQNPVTDSVKTTPDQKNLPILEPVDSTEPPPADKSTGADKKPKRTPEQMIERMSYAKIDSAYYEYGRAIVGSKKAGGLLKKLKDVLSGPGEGLDVLRRAKDASDPVEYIGGVIRKRRTTADKRAMTKDNFAGGTVQKTVEDLTPAMRKRAEQISEQITDDDEAAKAIVIEDQDAYQKFLAKAESGSKKKNRQPSGV